MAASCERLFRPRTIAAVGGHFAHAVVEQCRKIGFDGEIWPVHPSASEVCGLKAYRSVADLPSAPDAAFVGVNRELTLDIVRDLAARGTGGAVCYASGFSEAATDHDDAHDMQQALIEAAGDMPFLGPNCYGFINYLDGALLWPDQHGGERVETGVAILTQSSNIAINLTMQARGLPISYVLTLGNQAKIDLLAAASDLMKDPRVTAIGLHVEGIRDLAALEDFALLARKKKIPVVALLMGASDQAREAVISHTASMAGSHKVGQAVFLRLGIGTVDGVSSFLETLKLLHLFGPLPGRDICSMSCSGGEAALMADTALAHNVRFRPLEANEKTRVKAALPEMVVPANPLDYHTFIWADGPRMEAAFSAMIGTGFDLSILVIDFPRQDRCDDADWQITIDAIIAAKNKTGARVACLSTLAECLPENWATRLMEAGILPLIGMSNAFRAIDAAASIGDTWSSPPAPRLFKTCALDGSSRVLDEYESKNQLRDHGLPVVKGTCISSSEEAVSWAASRPGPVVLKALGIAHKSEAGAVLLSLDGDDAVREAADQLFGLSDRLLIEDMAADPVAEVIVGVSSDPVYGYSVTLGAGGILVELLEDTLLLPLPARREEIEAGLQSLKIYRLLDGFRGKPRGDSIALIDLVLALSDFVHQQNGRILEIDLNPVMVLPEGQGVIIADALVSQAG